MASSAEFQFDRIRSRWMQVQARRDAHRSAMLAKYGRHDPPRSWMNKGESARQDAILAADLRETERMCMLLDRVSPRNWRAGVPAHWLMSELTWEDAITSGRLSVVPPVAYGMTPRDVDAFSTAIAS
jgi:hypothetical protein